MSNNPNTPMPRWRAALQAALEETNPGLLAAKARAAQEAVFQRIQDSRPSPGFAEEQSLFDALEQLQALRARFSPAR